MCGSNLIGFNLAGAVEEPKGEFSLAFISYRLFLNPQLGLLRTDPVPEEGEDVAATISTTETLSEEEQEELRRELAKVKRHSVSTSWCALKVCCHLCL